MLIPSDPIICRDRPIHTASVIDGHNVRAGSRIENKWFPKAEGLWRVQGGALWPCFLGLRPTLVAYSVMNEFNPVGQYGAKYCRPCGLVQWAIMRAHGRASGDLQ